VYADDVGYFTHSRHEPYGVVGAIAPWNFPFLNAVWKTGPPLSVGNSVILKMAEQTPLTTSLYGDLCLEAGIPPGVVNVVHGDGPTTGASLVAHPRVPKITFTGSTEVGAEILRRSAPHIKSCHLELGGKTANIVFSDADLGQALTGSLFTSFFNSGQICTSGSRLLVHDKIASEFVDNLRSRADALRVGDPLSPDTDLGPLISATQLARVEGYVRAGVEGGAQLITGGVRPESVPRGGYFYEPSIFTNVEPGMAIAQEEIFGPVLSVMTFADEDEATSLANDVCYGLAASVWTNKLDRALRMIDQLDSGIVWTNCPHHLVWNAPYEGRKRSGLGEDLGLEAMRTFTQLKVSYINTAAPQPSWGTNDS
jgi:acyl-CoA reductase-like NAD-dependent aldehyde dehydrogenase